jgi:uncharacterized protein (DUF934 family)
MRRVLRRREIIADVWRHFEEEPPTAGDARNLILPLQELRADPKAWSAYPGPLGLRIAPADKVEDLAAELPRLALIAVEFPSPTEGRGYTQGRLLRGRLGFAGELRAVGAAVKRDLIFALVRCGFDAFEVAPGEDLMACAHAYSRYTVAYQPGAPGSLTLRQRFSA